MCVRDGCRRRASIRPSLPSSSELRAGHPEGPPALPFGSTGAEPPLRHCPCSLQLLASRLRGAQPRWKCGPGGCKPLVDPTGLFLVGQGTGKGSCGGTARRSPACAGLLEAPPHHRVPEHGHEQNPHILVTPKCASP